MDPRPSVDTVTLKAVAACERAEVEYAIIGGISVGAFGVARVTDDADLVLALGKDDVERTESFLAELAAEGFRFKPDAVRRRLQQGRGLFHAFLGLTRLDLLLKRPDAYWQDVFRHRRKIRLFGTELWFASPEDVIGLKLVAGRPEDLKDVRSIMDVKRGELDRPRLRSTVARYARSTGRTDLEDLLERYLAEADALPDDTD